MSAETFVIGRAGDITLYDDTVSRRHAEIEVDGDKVVLRDLDSRNGTYKIVDKKLIPFSKGEVSSDEVFAFGECVRSVKQLLSEVGVGQSRLAETSVSLGDDDDDPLSATQVGFSLPQRRRLSKQDILAMLDRIEDFVNAGGALATICEELGISEQRYDRWCREHGATRDEREKSTSDLQRENARLRKLVADLSLERDAMREALQAHGIDVDSHSSDDDDLPPQISIVGGDTIP